MTSEPCPTCGSTDIGEAAIWCNDCRTLRVLRPGHRITPSTPRLTASEQAGLNQPPTDPIIDEVGRVVDARALAARYRKETEPVGVLPCSA